MESKHCIKLSTQYRTAIKILRKVIVNGESLKTLLFNEKHARINRLNALLDKFFSNRDLIERVIEKSEILKKETRFDPYTCRILVTELLLGHENGLTGQAIPIQKILAYRTQLIDLFNELKGNNFTAKKKVLLPRYVRVNTLKITFDDALEECRREGFYQVLDEFDKYSDFLEAVKNLDEYAFLVDFHVKHLLVFSSKTRSYWARNPLVADHKFILQDKASCLPPILLELTKKSTILDMCAAPGMKTTQMAAIIKNKGKIYANDYDKKRYEMLCENLKNKNVKFIPLNRDAMQITGEEFPNVDYILVDPSCSSSGMASRVCEKEPSRERLHALSKLQSKLLVHTLQSFACAKRVVYSTCSIYAEENEYVVQKALQRCPNFELMDPRLVLGDSWTNFGSKEFECGTKCVYCHEETDLTNGFFCAIFVNRNGAAANGKGDIVRADNQNEMEQHAGDGDEVNETKVKKKKKSKHNDNDHELAVIEGDGVATELGSGEMTKSKKKRKRENADGEAENCEVEVGENVAGDGSVKKKKKKRKDAERELDVEANVSQTEVEPEIAVETQKTKKKKKKRVDN